MKKILFLLPVLFLCIFSSCKKCKDCNCSQVISQTGMPDVTQDVDFNNICDDDLEVNNPAFIRNGKRLRAVLIPEKL